MFLLRWEFNYFKRRMLLISSVVGMLTILTCFLSGLTGGLAEQNINRIMKIDSSNIILQSGVKTLTDSTVSEKIYKELSGGADGYTPIGVSQFNINNGAHKSGVSIFGDADVKAGEIVLSERAAEELKVTVGKNISISGGEYRVSKITENEWYGHAPVVAINIGDWRKFQKTLTGDDVYATMLLAPDGARAPSGYESYSKYSLMPLIGSFRSEIGSLALIIGMLITISSFMSAAFLYIWNSQRRRDFATIKALGGDGKLIGKTVVIQSAVIMGMGVIMGGLVTAFFGYLLSKTTIPYMLNAVTIVAPPLILFVCGVLGSLFTIKTVLKSDALEALEG